LHLLKLLDVLDGVEARVLGKAHWDLLKGISECAHGVLLNSHDLVSLLRDLNRASELSGTTSSDNVVVLDHVSNDADGVEEASLGLVTNGPGATSNEDGDSLGVFALLDEHDLIVGGSELELLDDTSLSKLLGRDLLESWDNSSSSGDGKKLNLDSTNPSDGGKFVVHEEMVCLIVETPLADDNGGAGVLNLLDHIDEILLLHVGKLFVVGSRLDLEAVLGLGLGRLKGAGEDSDLGVVDLLLHLGMREIFIKDNSFDESRIFESTTSLGDDLDEVEVNILSLEIGDMENRLDSEVSVVGLAFADDLRAEGSHGALAEELVVVLGNVNFLLDLIKLLDSDLTSGVEAICNLKGVETLIKELLGLLKDCTSEDHNTGSTITDFVILRG
jgi:hypothetical protein